MARFYNTDKSQFLQDFVYQPPWEMMNQALATQQQGYDNTIANAQILDNLDIKYLDGEGERKNVEGIKSYYGDKANAIIDSIKSNPNDWRKQQGAIRNLQKELQTDMQTGNISKIQGSYSAYQKYAKDMEKSREKDPSRFNAAMSNANSRWGGDSLNNSSWSQQDIIQTPDFQKLLAENMKELTASSSKRVSKAPDGRGYLIDNEQYVESLTPEHLMGYVASKLLADPNNIAWAKQSQDWGLGNYFDKSGNMIPLMSPETTAGPGGKPITRMRPNTESGFAPILNAAGMQGYQKSSTKTSYEADSTVNQALNRDHAFKLEAFKNDLRGLEGDKKFKQSLQLKALDGDQAAQQLLDNLNGKVIAGIIPAAPLTLDENEESMKNSFPDAINKNNDAVDFAIAQLKLKPNSDASTLVNFVEGRMKEGFTKEQATDEYLTMTNGSRTYNLGQSGVVGFQKMLELSKDGRYAGIPGMTEFKASITEPTNRIVDKYREAKSKYFENVASENKSVVMLEPLVQGTSSHLKSQVQTMPDAFYVVDAKGKMQELPAGQDFTITHVSTPNARENIALRASFKLPTGETVHRDIFPKNSREGQAQTEVIRNSIIENGLVSKTSSLVPLLRDKKATEIRTQIQSMPTDPEGFKKIILTMDNGINLPLKEKGGLLYIYPPDGGDPRIVNDYTELTKMLY